MKRFEYWAFGRITVVSLAVLALASFAPSLHSQDTRTVKEPVIPPVCTTLKAVLTAASASSGEIEARADKSGADSAGLDTARIQAALGQCAKGRAVELAADGANTAFLTGPLTLHTGVTLLLDKGATLYGSRNPEFYALKPGSCGVVNDATGGCKPLIAARSASGSAIMGDGIIDGQGGARLVVDGQLTTKTWWDLADDAHSAGHQQSPRMVNADLSDDFTLYRVTLRNSPNLHLSFHRGDGLTIWGVKIDTPKNARNTDGIDTEQAKNITVTQSWIRTGDDNIAIKAGDGPTTNMTVSHNHFYWGHGMTIGMETNSGVSQIRVQDLTLDGPENGLRIKSVAAHGGLVDDVTYDDICIRDVKTPIVFDTAYSFPGRGVLDLPEYNHITLHDVRILGGGKIQFNGFDNTHRIDVKLDGVDLLDSPDHYRAKANHTDLTYGTGPVNVTFIGDDSTVTGKPASGKLPACTTKFVPFP